jgi:VanZ family protein
VTPSRFLRILFIWAPPIAYLGLIFYLSAQSTVPWASPYPDWLLHGLEYMGLALLLARALNGGLGRVPATRMLLLTWGACVVWAISDELHQRFVPGRTCDPRDAFADAVGAALGLLALRLTLGVWHRSRPSASLPGPGRAA